MSFEKLKKSRQAAIDRLQQEIDSVVIEDGYKFDCHNHGYLSKDPIHIKLGEYVDLITSIEKKIKECAVFHCMDEIDVRTQMKCFILRHGPFVDGDREFKLGDYFFGYSEWKDWDSYFLNELYCEMSFLYLVDKLH